MFDRELRCIIVSAYCAERRDVACEVFRNDTKGVWPSMEL
jgi:hypothetical protein